MTGGRDELAELLQRAGLEIVGDRRTEEVLPPRAAWRPVVAFEAEPTVTVQIDRPDLVTELNTQWHRRAVNEGILGEDGEFLIDVAGSWTGCAPRRWTRVRLTDRWDLAGVLGERPGQPEFLTLSADGNTLLAATTEEYEVRLVTVDRIKERQEAAAQRKARESPEERAAAWASLLRGRVRGAGCASSGRMAWHSTRPHRMTCAPGCWVCRTSSWGVACPPPSWRRRWPTRSGRCGSCWPRRSRTSRPSNGLA